MTIIEFLEARITEDEYEAKTCLARYERGEGASKRRWIRMLAECKSKRVIIGLHQPDRILENWYWSQRKCAECGGTWHKWLNNDVPTDIGPEQGCATLRAIAAIYSDHPDYKDEWQA